MPIIDLQLVSLVKLEKSSSSLISDLLICERGCRVGISCKMKGIEKRVIEAPCM